MVSETFKKTGLIPDKTQQEKTNRKKANVRVRTVLLVRIKTCRKVLILAVGGERTARGRACS